MRSEHLYFDCIWDNLPLWPILCVTDWIAVTKNLCVSSRVEWNLIQDDTKSPCFLRKMSENVFLWLAQWKNYGKIEAFLPSYGRESWRRISIKWCRKWGNRGRTSGEHWTGIAMSSLARLVRNSRQRKHRHSLMNSRKPKREGKWLPREDRMFA